MTDPLPLLKDLISIPSVNPMGRDVSGPEFFEGRLTEYLVQHLSRLGVPYEVIETVPGRANVLARLESPGATKTVLLDAHQDTVPVDGMTISPFDPVEQDGRVYGRGSCDVKGGLASMLAAFTRLATERPAGLSNVVLSCTCDEEATSLGINHLVGSWTGKKPPGKLCPQRPDMAIVAEPTELNIVVAHRGATRWKLQTTGRACHSSRPSEGINAIYRMARVLKCLEEFAEWLPGSRPAHRLCGPATLSVGLISGGSSVNVVPDACVIEIDRRVIPGEDNLQVQAEIASYLKERLNFDLIHGEPYCSSPPLGDDLNGELAKRLGQSIAAVVGPRQVIGVPFGTHASRIAKIGIPSVVFGPGNIAQAHTKDEWIDIAQLRQAADVYYHFCANAR
jgi:acetylornithine deacetylase/succinyl-diaminopimelate desuccinylase family protein